MFKRIRAKYRYWFGYKPKDFGFDMPEMRRIYIGRCGGKGTHKYADLLKANILAHSHPCLDDKKRGIVCVQRMSYIFYNNGEVLWHEYAHLLDPTVGKWRCIDKLAYLRYNGIADPAFQDLFHGIEFVRIMKNFGYVGLPWVSIPKDYK